MKRKLIGYYDYTVILTYLGAACAFCGILFAVSDRFCEAVLCLMASGLCDMFDGFVASTKTRDLSEKRFGIQIDSLSDLVSFGVMPALFVFLISDRKPVIGVLAFFYMLAGLIRLAYYNVLEEHRQEKEPERHKSFLGLPITTIALVLPLAFLIYTKFNLNSPALLWVSLALCGTGFLTPVEIKYPNNIFKTLLALVGFLEVLGLFFMRAVLR